MAVEKIYVGITAFSAIAGPIHISCAHFTKPIKNKVLIENSLRFQRTRHLDFDLLFENIETESESYKSTEGVVTLNLLNRNEYDVSYLVQNELNSIITRHSYAHGIKLDESEVHVQFLASHPNINYISYEGEHLYRNFASWLSRKSYTEQNVILDPYRQKYNVDTVIPMSTKKHQAEILIQGPDPNFHRRSSMLRAREWPWSWKGSDPKYYKIRFYRYRKPKWWKAWFPNEYFIKPS